MDLQGPEPGDFSCWGGLCASVALCAKPSPLPSVREAAPGAERPPGRFPKTLPLQVLRVASAGLGEVLWIAKIGQILRVAGIYTRRPAHGSVRW
jgi:hypothetical protein